MPPITSLTKNTPATNKHSPRGPRILHAGNTKHKNTTMKYAIKAQYYYYAGTYNAPQDGYLMDLPSYDSFTGKETQDRLLFDTIQDAVDYLTNDDGGYEAMCCTYDGDARFSVDGGPYVCSHGQYARPDYTIVSASSGRASKALIAQVDAMMAATD